MGEGVLTATGLTRIDGTLCCDAVPIRDIARHVENSCYVYSAGRIRECYATLIRALAGIDVRLHYSVKANSSLALLTLLRQLGAGVDIVSGGELYRSLRAGFTGADVVFSGVGKGVAELEAALRAGVKMINVESVGELEVLHAVAQHMGVVAPIALRVNPDVSVDTPHHYTRTGERGMKFGIPDDQVVEVAQRTMEMPHVRLVGIAAHIGSPDRACGTVRDDGAAAVGFLRRDVRARHHDAALHRRGRGIGNNLRYGGPYRSRRVRRGHSPHRRPGHGLQLVMEPGRYLVADAGR